MSLDKIIHKLRSDFGEALLDTVLFRGETTLFIAVDQLHPVMASLRDDHGFNMLLDIASLDQFGSEPRFEMIYELYSLDHRNHLRVRTALASSSDPKVHTVSDLWATANWHEREVYDMMGIHFENHPDLTRILMWEGYPFYPLRKDFPLAGKPSDVPDVAFSGEAPQQGGPFVTTPGGDVISREPRSRERS